MKYTKLIFVFVFAFLSFQLNCFASVKTYNRTNENLLIPGDVAVTQDNIEDILKTPAVSSSEKIYDYADLYTNEEEEKLFARLKAYIDNSDIDACIVTTKNLNGFLIKDYAYNFYDYNDFKSDGIVFVIYIGSNEPQIFMGNSGDSKGKVFSIYTQVKVNQILKYVYTDIKNKQYYKATDDYIKILQGFFDISRDGDYRVNNTGEVVKVIPWIAIGVLSITLTITIIILLFYQLKRYNKVVYTDELESKIDVSTLMVKTEMDDLVDTIISKEK